MLEAMVSELENKLLVTVISQTPVAIVGQARGYSYYSGSSITAGKQVWVGDCQREA